MTNRYSLMFISCWVFFPLESAGNLSLTADSMLLSFNSSTYWGEKVPLSNILSSHQLSVCYSDPSSRTSDFPLGKRELDFFPLRYQQGKKKTLSPLKDISCSKSQLQTNLFLKRYQSCSRQDFDVKIHPFYLPESRSRVSAPIQTFHFCCQNEIWPWPQSQT